MKRLDKHLYEINDKKGIDSVNFSGIYGPISYFELMLLIIITEYAGV